MKTYLRPFIFLIITSLFLFKMPASVFSQEISLSITPPTSHIVTKRNIDIPFPYSVVNYGDPTMIRITVYSLKITDTAGSVSINPLTNSDITFDGLSSEPFLLLSKQAYEGNITIHIPDTIDQKDYYYILVAETEKAQGFDTGSQVQLLGGISSTLAISVTDNGKLESETTIQNFSVNGKTMSFFGKKIVFIDSGNPIPINLIVENKGENITFVTTNISLSQSVNFLPFTPYSIQNDHANIFSHSQETITLPAIPSQILGSFKLRATISEKDSQKQFATLSFIVFPFTLTSRIFLSCLLALSTFLIYKRYTNTQQ